MEESHSIDDSLYSRQRYVLGDEGMHSLAHASVLVHGLGGVGVEIAKNLVLAGVKMLHLQDSKVCQLSDMGSQFYITEKDVEFGKTRAEASISCLAKLNPYVILKLVAGSLEKCDQLKLEELSFLSAYKVIVLTDCTLPIINYVDYYCHHHGIQLIVADVIGLMASMFCDFGPSFSVNDSTGEESRELFINLRKEANNSVCAITTLYNEPHGLQTGDLISIKDIEEISTLCDIDFTVTVKSTDTFLITCDALKTNLINERGRVVTKPKPALLHFNTFHDEILHPHLQCIDFCKPTREKHLHVAYLLLKRLFHLTGHYVISENDMELIEAHSKKICDGLDIDEECLDEIRTLLLTSSGYFQPLAAFLGGVAAQEVLKAVSRKFTPLHQWMHLDSAEVADLSICNATFFKRSSDFTMDCRFLPLLRCIQMKGMNKLINAKVFLVGCGAIGCELLKNLAMLGIGMHGTGNDNESQCCYTFSGSDQLFRQMERGDGEVFITDDDHIEKSNLNRQFLFRECHIRQSKSVIARSATLELNPDMRITAYQKRVGVATEREFNDVFFSKLDACINALDNVEARRYMDQRCVTNGRSLFESGTLGTKGHVQTIVAYLTEHYTAQQDPVHETDVAYCTLKSFPANLEHCIEWAREKFLSQFHLKPQNFKMVWSQYHFNENGFLNELRNAANLNSIRPTNNMNDQGGSGNVTEIDISHIMTSELINMLYFLRYKPITWDECVKLARLKFEKHFNHKAKQLLHNFPTDSKLSDGSPFWQSPKRPPTPLEFSFSDENCLLYLRSTAQLFAQVCHIPYAKEDLNLDELRKHLEGFVIEEFKPVDKIIVTNESLNKEDILQEQHNQTNAVKKSFNINRASDIIHLITWKQSCYSSQFPSLLANSDAEEFEKDNDENGHIDFITAASNLRAKMYGIETADRYHIKRIAGRIIPAIATTTAAVAGLVTIELVKYLLHRDKIPAHSDEEIQRYRNTFLNLALPMIILSEPGAAQVKWITDKHSFTAWDTEMFSRSYLPDTTLKGFKFALEDRFGLPVNMIIFGKRILYSDILPGHEARLKKNFMDLLRCDVDETVPYVDLLVTFRNYYPKVKDASDKTQENHSMNGEDERDVEGPRIRFYLN